MKKEIRAISIVAHPDDETIWMGGTIERNKNWKWTILSLCRKNDEDRMPKFMKVCENYGAVGIISDLDDEKLTPLKIDEVKDKIKENLSLKEYDYVFTHGENGEYGHIRHKEVHKAVRDLIEKEEIRCKKLFCFSYKKEGDVAIPEIRCDAKIKLSERESEIKRKVVTDLYGFDENSFEALSCNGMEAFDFI